MSLKAIRPHYFKIILIGDSGVGKTAMVQRFVNDIFSQTMPTISAGMEFIEVAVDDKPVKLQIWDTAGQERFQSLGQQYYREADCCALVFDICNHESYQRIAEWRDLFLNSSDIEDPQTFPFVLIGTKNDIANGNKKDLSKLAQQWCKDTAATSIEEMTEQYKQLNQEDFSPEQMKKMRVIKRQDLSYKIPYFDVSAKTGENVNDCFIQMAKLAVSYEIKKNFNKERSGTRQKVVAQIKENPVKENPVKENDQTPDDLLINGFPPSNDSLNEVGQNGGIILKDDAMISNKAGGTKQSCACANQ